MIVLRSYSPPQKQRHVRGIAFEDCYKCKAVSISKAASIFKEVNVFGMDKTAFQYPKEAA